MDERGCRLLSAFSLIHVNLIVDSQVMENQFLTVEGDQIAQFGGMELFSPQGQQVIDGGGQYVCPSYIDIHTHGAMMQDTMNATKEALDAICRFQFSHGVGTFLPTTLTAPLEEVEQVLLLLRRYVPCVPIDIPGAHLEGPFLSAVNRGAQPEEYLLTPGERELRFIDEYSDVIRLITISPDVKNIVALIRKCRERGIVVSGGHDASIDDEIYAAMEAGMSGVTHIFCCSSTVSRRPDDPRKHLGLTELGLLSDSLYAEAIADCCHLPADLLRLVYRSKGCDKICFVSDSISAAGMEPGCYMLGSSATGVEIRVTDQVALVKDRNLFAGSITPVDRMVRNAVETGIPLAEAVTMASETPARVLGLRNVGKISPGYRAKLNLISQKGELLGMIWNGDGICWSERGQG